MRKTIKPTEGYIRSAPGSWIIAPTASKARREDCYNGVDDDYDGLVDYDDVADGCYEIPFNPPPGWN